MDKKISMTGKDLENMLRQAKLEAYNDCRTLCERSRIKYCDVDYADKIYEIIYDIELAIKRVKG